MYEKKSKKVKIIAFQMNSHYDNHKKFYSYNKDSGLGCFFLLHASLVFIVSWAAQH